MRFMIRFSPEHESFHIPELEALAIVEEIPLKIISYKQTSPFCFVDVPSEEAARRLIRRSILAKAIYEAWGSGTTYAELHENVRRNSRHLWALYKDVSFRFTVDSFQGSRTSAEQRALIEGFKFLGFEGPIRMKNPDQNFYISEDWEISSAGEKKTSRLLEVHLNRFISNGERDIINKYDLKKRKYISTTSMDSELALVTANISLAAPGKLFYDPFVGTGSFPIACAHFGAVSLGSDIDGRSIRGTSKRNLLSNFSQYNLVDLFGDSFVADLTNTPIRSARLFDGIICDPPYGVREGLRVLGSRDPTAPKEPVIQNGIPTHLEQGYIPPKRPYSFLAMLDDILDFAALTLVEDGRLSFWMPTANEQDQAIAPPLHPCLVITSVCTQNFYKWSRLLITYRRLRDTEVSVQASRRREEEVQGKTADDLNPFRKLYFEGFKAP